MTHDERIAAQQALLNAMRFPADRFGQRAVEAHGGLTGKTRKGYGLYPEILGGGLTHRVAWCRLEDGYLYDPFDIAGSLPSGPGGKVDIARRARSLVGYLRNFGVDDYTHADVAPECKDEWGEDYAIVQDAYSPEGEGVYGDYFDHDSCVADFMAAVREFFACDPTVDVRFHNLRHGSNEIEFVRITP